MLAACGQFRFFPWVPLSLLLLSAASAFVAASHARFVPCSRCRWNTLFEVMKLAALLAGHVARYGGHQSHATVFNLHNKTSS